MAAKRGFHPRMQRRAIAHAALIEALEPRQLLAFSLATTATTFTVDTNAGVVFSVLRQGTSSTIHSGDLTSFKLNGVEFAAPFSSPSRYSHFESGLSNTTTVVSAEVDPAGNWIKITADDLATIGVIQYYIAHKNDPVIYMASYAPSLLVSSTRFITYLDWNKFPNHPNESDTSAIHGVPTVGIETEDVRRDPVDGTTHSKYYGENRLVDHVYHGATGPSSGAFMFIGSRESGSGGPFWKDIDFQSTGAAVELYNIPYSDHSQSEPFRPGLHGPYALVLTGGEQPTIMPDYTFLDTAGLAGWVSPSARGTLTGVASGYGAGKIPTVALSNSIAQYWATPDALGNYTIPNIKPGTYTETLYEEELAVGTRTVTISANKTTHANIVSTYYLPSALWRIGTWDGTPREFRNGDRITYMHPSDPRMNPWADSTGVTNFVVGTNVDSDWPMAEWKYQIGAAPYVDTQNRITFNLTAVQAATALTLRIGITRLDHGRPNISVNGNASPAAPGLTTQPTARGLTLGSWRGNNTLYTYNLSTSQLHAGTNTIDIFCVSGSGSGGNYLSPWHIYDALDLVPTSNITNAPRVTTIQVSPGSASVNIGAQSQFGASSFDQFGQPIAANFFWSTSAGSVDPQGLYTAPTQEGAGTITVSSGNVSKVANITIVDPDPLRVVSSSWEYSPAQRLILNFNKDVTASLTRFDIGIENLTTSTTISPFSILIDYAGLTDRFVFTEVLPNGYYKATLPAGSVQSATGAPMAQAAEVDFFILAGDANHDAVVNIADLRTLAANFSQSGKTFAQGDFDYDGDVDRNDLAILSRNWQHTPDGSAAAAAPMPTITGVTDPPAPPVRPTVRPTTRIAKLI